MSQAKFLEFAQYYIRWRSLCTMGVIFWLILWTTDILGDCSWRKHSEHVAELLSSRYQQMLQAPRPEAFNIGIMNWLDLVWNIFAFMCSLVFCSLLRKTSWIAWKAFRMYNIFHSKQPLVKKAPKRIEVPKVGNEDDTTEVIFKNCMFEPNKQEKEKLVQELEVIKRQKNDISQQLLQAQKENLIAREQIEEFKLETFMIKNKLALTKNSLKETIKSKSVDNQNVAMKKAHNLEIHLKEMSRDREMLRNKVSVMEKNCLELENRLRIYEKSESNLEPEKDNAVTETHETLDSEETTEREIFQFHTKLDEAELQVPHDKSNFEANSKISMDLEESEVVKENEQIHHYEKRFFELKPDISMVKQNILNYNAYKMQMLKPKMKLSNIREHNYASLVDTTGSSSDDGAPNRIISSTLEFQNFLKTLTSPSDSSLNFQRNIF